MGLDINVYKNLKIVEKPEFDEDGYVLNWDSEWMPGESMVWSEEHFPGRGEGVNPRTVYSWEDKIRFRAGSYSGYNWWRRQLEQFAKGNDFQELINFADNEGVIGSVVSKKLANDFAENLEEAVEFAVHLESETWLELYNDWKKAFEMASNNGAVEFC